MKHYFSKKSIKQRSILNHNNTYFLKTAKNIITFCLSLKHDCTKTESGKQKQVVII